MEKTISETTTEVLIELPAPMLSAKQASQRKAALLAIIESFTQAIEKDAFTARGELAETIFRRLQTDEDLSWHEHAQLCVGLCDIRTRDGLLRMLHDAPELRSIFQSHLLRELARSDNQYAAALATVYAGISWLEGQEQLTRLAIDHALRIDATYSLAQLLDIALRHNVPPTVWSASLAAVSFDACLRGAA